MLILSEKSSILAAFFYAKKEAIWESEILLERILQLNNGRKERVLVLPKFGIRI